MTSEEGPQSTVSNFVDRQPSFNFRRACGVIVTTTFSHIPTNKFYSLPAFSEASAREGLCEEEKKTCCEKSDPSARSSETTCSMFALAYLDRFHFQYVNMEDFVRIRWQDSRTRLMLHMSRMCI